MTKKQRYIIFCDEHPEIPLFMQAWWLDAVCIEEKTWDVLLCEENGKIVGAMPYHLLKKWGFKTIIQPQLTQYNGIWIDYPKDQKLHKRYSFEKRVMDNLIDQLENQKWDFYSQNFHYSFKNWQPFYWREFRQTTRYTYRINDLSDLEKVFENFSYAKQKHIKKENDDLQIEFSLSANDFFVFHKDCLKQKNVAIEYSQKLFLSFYNETDKRKQGKIISLKDKNNNLHSALFFVWDKNSAYALISAINPQFKSDGASTKIFWETIKFVSDKTKAFDFEGSMIKGVAQSFQQFGAEQVSYFNISKSKSYILNLVLNLKK
jgi:hypothetical protein